MTTIACSGHQVLPLEALDALRRGIVDVLAEHSPDLTGVCSLAAGADQLFAELVLERGAALEVVVPSQHYESTFAAPDRVAYEQLRAHATTVTTLPFDIPSEAAFYAAGRTVVDRADLLIAVWDGEPARGWGGTADVVAYPRHADTPVVVVWPRGVQRTAPPPPD